ncbi:MAG: CinA family protein [Treponema sp.]|nr:CinA family protein [Treponema sp.]
MPEQAALPLLDELAARLVEAAGARGLTVAAAESCTGGRIADCLARIPGASRVLWGSFVCYSIEAKDRMLGIPPDTAARFGAVSREIALAMARAALEQSGADMAVSATGLAGPEGDGSPVPVGTVWIGSARRGGAAEASVYHFEGSRNEVRDAAAGQALHALLSRVIERT